MKLRRWKVSSSRVRVVVKLPAADGSVTRTRAEEWTFPRALTSPLRGLYALSSARRVKSCRWDTTTSQRIHAFLLPLMLLLLLLLILLRWEKKFDLKTSEEERKRGGGRGAQPGRRSRGDTWWVLAMCSWETWRRTSCSSSVITVKQHVLQSHIFRLSADFLWLSVGCISGYLRFTLGQECQESATWYLGCCAGVKLLLKQLHLYLQRSSSVSVCWLPLSELRQALKC